MPDYGEDLEGLGQVLDEVVTCSQTSLPNLSSRSCSK